MLTRRISFKPFIFVLSLAAILHIAATNLYIYWTISWFDMVVHFIAGTSASLGIILFLEHFFPAVLSSYRKTFFLSILFVLVVGAIWEVFELYFNFTSFSDGWMYVFDTAIDFAMDTLGGMLGLFYSFYILRKN